MNMSLDRLIRLAQRTGDRLIVHDPSGENDLVIMDVDSYERLLETESWKSKRDVEEKISNLDEFEDGMPWDKPSSWYSAADVLGEKPSPKFDPWIRVRDTYDDIKIEDVPSGSEATMDDWTHSPTNISVASTDLSSQTLPVQQTHSSPPPSIYGEEALADDEPVFYEEPV